MTDRLIARCRKPQLRSTVLQVDYGRGVTAMNEPNIKKLGDWLRAGAPGVIFNMFYGVADAGCTLKYAGQHSIVCGVAGAAYLMKHAEDANIASLDEMSQQLPVVQWDEIDSIATEWLGIDPYLAKELYCGPFHYTPQQAAVALDRVASGLRPWGDGRERAQRETRP